MTLAHPIPDCPRCEELQAEVAWLKDELGNRTTVERLAALKALGCAPAMGRLALAMLAKPGRAVSSAALIDAMPQKDPAADRDDRRVLHVHISRLRLALGKGCVENCASLGYRLTDIGITRLRDALGDLAP